MAAAKQSASDKIYKKIKQAIITQQLAPGQRLVEADMVRELQCSRPTLRDAFARLSAEYLIELIPNKGAYVRKLSTQEMMDIQMLLLAVEPLMARQAAERRTQTDIDILKKQMELIRESVSVGDFSGAGYHIVNFKHALAKTSKNKSIIAIVRRQYALLCVNASNVFPRQTDSTKNDLEQTINYFQQLLDAVEAGNAAEAEAHSREQIEYGLTYLNRNISRYVFEKP